MGRDLFDRKMGVGKVFTVSSIPFCNLQIIASRTVYKPAQVSLKSHFEKRGILFIPQINKKNRYNFNITDLPFISVFICNLTEPDVSIEFLL